MKKTPPDPAGERWEVKRLQPNPRLVARVHYTDSEARRMLEHAFGILFARAFGRAVSIVCIGSLRNIGDSLGPRIGSRLEAAQIPCSILGTKIFPLHAGNMRKRLARLPSDGYVIAVDACVGRSASLGYLTVAHGSIKPGIGIGNEALPDVGDAYIAGVVSDSGGTLCRTPVALVEEMADIIAGAIVDTAATRLPAAGGACPAGA